MTQTSARCNALGVVRHIDAGGHHYICELPADHDGKHAATGSPPDPQTVEWVASDHDFRVPASDGAESGS